MRATMDGAGRVVIPKSLRDRLGIRPGPVELTVDGATLRIAPIPGSGLAEESGRLVIPESGTVITDAEVDGLRRADQK